MHKAFKAGTRWVLVLVIMLVGLLAVGIAILPEVFRRGYLVPEIVLNTTTLTALPAGYYVLSLFTLLLFAGVVIALFLERFEVPMMVAFIAFRLAAEAWQYQLGRESLFYLIASIAGHVIVGGLVLYFFSGRMRLPPGQIGPHEDIP